MTQRELVRAHLESGKPLTPLEALNDYGCFRLAARIEELRKMGLGIKTTMITKGGRAFAQYKMEEAA